MGIITHEVQLVIQYREYITLYRFLVADIGEDNLILGYPFFEAANPHIHWASGTLEGSVILSSYDDWEELPEGDKGTWLHARIAKTMVAQQLAEKVVDKKAQTWQELVP